MPLPFFSSAHTLVAGCDEVGRGCLAGPVVAAAVVLPPQKDIHPEITDSKKLTPQKRQTLTQYIQKNAVAYGIGVVHHTTIDEINILQAAILAMHQALDQLKTTPELLLIDGNHFKPYRNIPHHCIIQGDQKYQSIAAASIIAKTYRDQYMQKWATIYPIYGWEKNAGYPTAQHKKAIQQWGITPIHRISFQGV